MLNRSVILSVSGSAAGLSGSCLVCPHRCQHLGQSPLYSRELSSSHSPDRGGVSWGVSPPVGGREGEDPALDGFESEVCREEWAEFVCVNMCKCGVIHVSSCKQCHHIRMFVRAYMVQVWS